MRRSLVVLCFVLACSEEASAPRRHSDGDSDAPERAHAAASGSASASVAASAIASGAASNELPRGLAAKDLDPTIVTEMREVLRECKAQLEPMHFLDEKCPRFERLRDQPSTPQTQATWIELLFDPDPAVRRLAARVVKSFGLGSLHPDLSGKIVEALARDLGPSPSNTALAALAIDLDARDVGDRLVAIGTSTATPLDVRATLAMWWRDDRGHAVTASLAKEDSKAAKAAAIAGYARTFEHFQGEACGYWASFFTDPDPDLRKDALRFLSGSFDGMKATDSESDWYVMGGGNGPDDSGYSAAWCPDQIDPLLDVIEARIDKRDLALRPYLEAAGAVADHVMATDPQKKRATALLKKVIEDKAHDDRDVALTILVETFPSELSYAARFANDDALKETVARLRDRADHLRDMFKSRREAQKGTRDRLAGK